MFTFWRLQIGVKIALPTEYVQAYLFGVMVEFNHSILVFSLESKFIT